MSSRSLSNSLSSTRVLDFLLAGRTLRIAGVVNLLLSSSFGINAVFYAAWLGYSIGAWALAIQVAWSLSFFLLVPASKHFANVNSLHDFLGRRFGRATQVVAALCSVVGLSYLVGWEVGVARSAVSPLLASAGGTPLAWSGNEGNLLVGIFGLVTIAYSAFFGLRGNASTDKFLNLVKSALLVIICLVAAQYLLTLPTDEILSSAFPPFTAVVTSLGVLGLITNLLFNLSWQFVDNSSWQSIIGGAGKSTHETSRSLRFSGIAVFLTVNLLGTLLGISLAHRPDITADNILPEVVNILPQYTIFLSVALVALTIACMMSLIDGMLLASALALNVDVMESLDMGNRLSETGRLRLIKVSVVAIGLITIWGIDWLFQVWGGSLFDFVYIVVLTQLALLGPVLVGLLIPTSKAKAMWAAILGGLLAGFGVAAYGVGADAKEFVDGAGTFAIFTSVILAWLIHVTASRRGDTRGESAAPGS